MKLIMPQALFIVASVTPVNFQPEKKGQMKLLNVYS